MAETMRDRCIRICGSPAGDCFVSNRKQLECIADMVINKVFAVSSVIDLSMEEDRINIIKDNLSSALKSSNELISWIKYLQMTHDLNSLSLLLRETAGPDKRTETRFPLPVLFRDYIILQVEHDGLYRDVNIVDFSSQGLSFSSPEPIEDNSVLECLLTSHFDTDKAVSFYIKTKHCNRRNGDYIVGAKIEDFSDSSTFDFFRNVYDFMIDVVEREN
jgi:hypothetical protein